VADDVKKYVCIHGHFYQPPRENPWLEAIERQDSAYPYHDWNERITAECYGPNTAALILGPEERVEDVVNNYARISFNIGPTLLSWLETEQPEVYRGILEADRESVGRFGGHGSAMAQAHNHTILPLASERDKVTQVRWGVRDFTHRFGRRPEGMWLPETAVDVASLEVLAAEGVAFTVLAPHQARRVRPLSSSEWQSVEGARIDPRRPYRIDLPSGRSMALFFYDGPIARAVAFERLLDSGDRFARRLLEPLTGDGLSHIATDGESYGHHHRYGEMALAYALRKIERDRSAEIINYAAMLARHPPTHAVEIVDNTSWSCVHGIERWRSDCGCHTGGQVGWKQAWRAPLREALDWLRDRLASLFERRAAPLLADPWAARDAYIDVILDRSVDSVDRFLAAHGIGGLEGGRRSEALKLLELQRQAQLMYTSCGWFFSELSGIETVQVLFYAGRAVQLAQQLETSDLETRFLDRLSRAHSNLPDAGDGRAIFDHTVRPSRVDFPRVAAHYGVSSLFSQYGDQADVFGYRIDREQGTLREAGRARLACGLIRVSSRVTEEASTLGFGVLHLGDHNLSGGVRAFASVEDYRELVSRVVTLFDQGDLPETMRQLDQHLDLTYSLRSLFRDEQRRVMDHLVDEAMSEAEAVSRQLYEQHAALIRYLVTLRYPLPSNLRAAADFVLNTRLHAALTSDVLDPRQVHQLVEEARILDVPLDRPGLGMELERSLARLAGRFAADPDDLEALRALRDAVHLVKVCPFPVSTYTAQVRVFRLGHDGIAIDKRPDEWQALFREVSASLRVELG
jgi:alpha-amylase/alpha-mannosidase (GH57 family)